MNLCELIEEYLFAWELAHANQIKKIMKNLKAKNDNHTIYSEILMSLRMSSKNTSKEYPPIPEVVTLSSLKKYFF